MIEKRRGPRKRLDVQLQVSDAMTGNVVGQLSNISLEGLMLVTHAPIVDDALYQFTFQLPDSHGRLHPVEVGVHELWSERATMQGRSWAGFRIIDISPGDLLVLREWMMRAEGPTR
jgi:hypothetical protein